jgi:hypothetical protein
MSRRALVPIALMLSLIGANGLSVRTVGASPTRAVDPATIDPAVLALPATLLPPGSTIYHSGVSDNPDADAKTTPADGHQSLMTTLHLTQYGNEDPNRGNLGRLTGFRTDFLYAVSGATVGTEYLASIFASAAKAQTALDDATGRLSLIALIGKPLPQTCSVGEICKGFYGPNPLLAGQEVVVALYVDGPILVETVTSAPSSGFDTLEPALQSVLNSFLLASDTRVKVALGEGEPAGTPSAVATITPAPTATSVPALPTGVPSPPKKKHCKKGYKLSKGKCKKTKKHKS